MNDSARARHRPGRAWQPAAPSAAAAIAIAGLALLAACGGSSAGGTGSPNAGGRTNSPAANSQTAVAFSRCVRAHAVPNYPDPGSNGQLAKETAQQLGVSDSQLQAALTACEHLLPNTGNIDDNPAALDRWWSQMRRFAQCMHSHGVPNYPDPTVMPDGRPGFVISISRDGLDPHSPQVSSKIDECQRLTGSPWGEQVSP